ncbi:hypothetical protein RHGRI_022448 [Rhododendron griersonianum]|uniref:Uncharacterized protein n=1 Tax=Rhododendron griersonianum TaxID=479676 RepID=A0AAV6J4E5_9ERIC|nr:hypothetical protein RHGRI_022448 [Rhododendron griersonianum]
MFPWLAFGHMIPFLELSKLIAQKGHKISFLSTPRNINRLPKIPPSLSPLINFVKLPLPHVANLPENAEATTDLPYEKVKYLKIAYDRLQTPVTQFLKSSNPDWVFFDFAPYWLPQIASNLNISTAYFNILNAAILGFLGPVPVLKGEEDFRTKPEDFLVPPKWIPFESTVAYRLFEILRIFNDGVVGDQENVSDVHRFAFTIEGCDVIAVKSCSEFEPEWFQLLVDLHRKPVLPVGLLPASVDDGGNHGSGVEGGGWSEIENWLEKQEKGILEEKKLGYSIPRDEQDGSFDRESVAESLRLVMVEEDGEIYRNKVKEMSGLFGDRDRQDRYVDNLLGFLQSRKRIREST